MDSDPTFESEEWITVREAADRLGVSYGRARQLVFWGELEKKAERLPEPGIPVRNLVRASDVEARRLERRVQRLRGGRGSAGRPSKTEGPRPKAIPLPSHELRAKRVSTRTRPLRVHAEECRCICCRRRLAKEEVQKYGQHAERCGCKVCKGRRAEAPVAVRAPGEWEF